MKNQQTKIVVLIAILSLFFSITGVYGSQVNNEVSCEVMQTVRSNNRFATDLYGQLSGEKGNLFFSPWSVSVALAMTYAGARGETAGEMERTLHFSSRGEELNRSFCQLIDLLNQVGQKEDYQLSVANRLWGQTGYHFLESFLEITQKYYHAQLKQLNFEKDPESARKTINNWVEEKTNDKIKELLKPDAVNSLTTLILTNAIYFKGTWKDQFNPEKTAPAPFYLLDDKKVEVPTMARTGSYGFAQLEGLKVLELPYSDRELSMIVLLPDEDKTIKQIEQQLTAENLDAWIDSISQQRVRVEIPKFKTTSSFSLGDVLQKMGMKTAFTPGADFSGMTGNRELFISAVIHKAFVEVSEEGTEAAAATAVTMMRSSIPGKLYRFIANRPFIFLIRHNETGSILFMGRIMNPSM